MAGFAAGLLSYLAKVHVDASGAGMSSGKVSAMVSFSGRSKWSAGKRLHAQFGSGSHKRSWRYQFCAGAAIMLDDVVGQNKEQGCHVGLYIAL